MSLLSFILDELERLLRYTFPKQAGPLLRKFRLKKERLRRRKLFDPVTSVYNRTSSLDSPPSGDSSGEVVMAASSPRRKVMSRPRNRQRERKL